MPINAITNENSVSSSILSLAIFRWGNLLLTINAAISATNTAAPIITLCIGFIKVIIPISATSIYTAVLAPYEIYNIGNSTNPSTRSIINVAT